MSTSSLLVYFSIYYFDSVDYVVSFQVTSQHNVQPWQGLCEREALWSFFFFSPFLYVPCSHCYTFPSSMCVRRRHPQSCIFVNWKGSGSGGCRGEGGDSSRLLGWLTFQPQTQREMAGENEATCVCVCVNEYVYVHVCVSMGGCVGWVISLINFPSAKYGLLKLGKHTWELKV